MDDAMFAAAVPVVLRFRVAAWRDGAADDDDVGVLWERIRRGAPLGAGFGRDLFELREDPAAVWVAAYAMLAQDDPIATQLTTRAMFARFGAALLDPAGTLAAAAVPALRPPLARALHAAAGDSGTPEPLRQRLLALSARVAGAPPPEAPQIRALWAEASARPDDLAPRHVLADLYTTLDDPRGPYMADALRALASGRRPRGEAAVLRRHEEAWLGRFGLVARPPRRWAGGVVVGCVVTDGAALMTPTPEWSFIEELHLGARWLLRALAPERFPRLRVIGGLSERDVPELADLPILPQLARIHIDGPLRDPGALWAVPGPHRLVVHGGRPLDDTHAPVQWTPEPWAIRPLPAFNARPPAG